MTIKNKIICMLITAILLPGLLHSKPRDIHATWQYGSTENIAGFRIYFKNNPACEIYDSSAKSMDCTIDAPDGESTFTITAFSQDGTESPHSAPFPYTFFSDLKAVITADPIAGETPLPITFNANSSTGDIISYEWMFGDGEAETGNTVNHTYVSAGNYIVTLKVTNSAGVVAQETITIVVSPKTPVNNPPTAIISSSKSVGEAPLLIEFDGSASSDSDGTIVTYGWDMGDGGSATGTKATYTYLNAGTFHATLTVTDNGGLTDTISTPVIVQPPVGNNIPPNAIILASTKSGEKPLSVTFNALNSNDPDGKIIAYSWNFGDGKTSASGSIKHIFTKDAIYTVTLEVTDNMGAISQPAKYTITVEDTYTEEPDGTFNILTIVNYLLLKH